MWGETEREVARLILTSGMSSCVDASVCRSYLSKDSVFLKYLTRDPYFPLLVQSPCLQVNITIWTIVLSHWFLYFLSVSTSNHPMLRYLPITALVTLFPFQIPLMVSYHLLN